MDIYLDNNATTEPDEEVVGAAMRGMRELWANPSSVHRAGQAVRQAVELAREEVAKLLGCKSREVIFTSGATEANNLAIRGMATARRSRNVIVTTATEHSSVREPCEQMMRRGYGVIHLPIDRNGTVDLRGARAMLETHGPAVAMVTVHWANNETGVVQPVEELAAMCGELGIWMHSDATQAAGKIPMDAKMDGLTAVSISGHKFHGVKGIGALCLRSPARIRPMLYGGPHERDRRGGTENVSGILAMGEAARRAVEWVESGDATRVEGLRDRLERELAERIGEVTVNGGGGKRLWNTTNVGFRGLEAEAILIGLSERGVYASAGAACSSGSLEPSPVLLAMGVEEQVAHGSVRFSLSRKTTEGEIDEAVRVVAEVVGKLRKTMPVG